MKKKLIISLIVVILVLGVAFAIGALVKKSKDTPQDMINRIESVIKEVLGDDVKKQTETVVAGPRPRRTAAATAFTAFFSCS